VTSDTATFLWHTLGNAKKKRGWRPFIAILYLTYECELRCCYCSDGQGRPYHSLATEPLPPEEVSKLLSVIRKHCNYLVITGGEPLQYPNLKSLWPKIAALKFKQVILTTNGRHLIEHLPGIELAVTQLVISVDTLNPDHANHIVGLGPNIFEQIRENIEILHRLTSRRFEIVISTVLTPKYLQDAYEVYALCKERRWYFAACPQLVGVKAHRAFQHNAEYQEFFQFLISEKRKNRYIFGTRLYLEHMRDLRGFECRPFAMLVVSPLGEVYYPCLELGNKADRLLEQTDLRKLRKQAEKRFGPQPVCDTQCHSACALGFSTLLNHPFETLKKEIFF
jgi:MoaA/NifB/PqqE/SkfB family radical SAM enzyme